MSGEIVNLRQARKARARAERETKAAENRVLFGRTKAEKRQEALEGDRRERHVEGHLRETDTPDPSGKTS
ncbi:DUF4169 family protein [Stappia sp. ICDLI1TA098]